MSYILIHMEHHKRDGFREERLNELRRVRNSRFFAGQAELVELLDKYIDMYSADREPRFRKDIKAITLFPEVVEDTASLDSHVS